MPQNQTHHKRIKKQLKLRKHWKRRDVTEQNTALSDMQAWYCRNKRIRKVKIMNNRVK